jgi:Bacterial protein of unknown function (YtfJ_HI0045)
MITPVHNAGSFTQCRIPATGNALRGSAQAVVACAIFAGTLTMLAASADALPAVGGVRPQAVVVDANGGRLDLRGINGKPTLVVYESQGAQSQNVALKDELSKLAKGEKYRNAIALIPVADVESYDYWPARGFVKSSIRSESRKMNATIYCDWDGSFRRTAGFRRDYSTIMLIGADGRVAWVYEGTVPAEERAKLIGMLKAQVGE